MLELFYYYKESEKETEMLQQRATRENTVSSAHRVQREYST